MINIQKHIGQAIISLESKKIIGYVSNVFVENRKVDSFLAFNDEQEIEFKFPSSAVLNLGNDALIIKNDAFISILEETKNFCILGLPIFSQEGNLIGYLRDLELFDNFKIKNLICKNNKIDINKVDDFSDNAILLKGKFKTKKADKFKTNFNYLVKIENEKNDFQSLPIITQKENNQPVIPAKTVANITGLIGKTLTKDIYYKNKLILKAGTIISQKVIELATLSGTVKDVSINAI